MKNFTRNLAIGGMVLNVALGIMYIATGNFAAANAWFAASMWSAACVFSELRNK